MKHASRRAHALLEEYCRSPEKTVDCRLPTLKALAAQADVSVGTMYGALQHFKRAGRLRAQRGRYIELATHRPSPLPDNFGPKHHRLCRVIEGDILNGRFPPSQHLPPFKELSVRYRTSHRTLRKALDTLVGRGILHDSGGSYVSAPVPKAYHSSSLLLVAEGTAADGTLDTSISPWFGSMLLQLESACAQSNLFLEFAAYNSRSDTLALPRTRSDLLVNPSRHRDLVGIHIWSNGMGNWDNVNLMLGRFCRLKKPVCVLDEATALSKERLDKLPAPPMLFTMALGEDAGFEIGTMLIARGHRRIAYVSPVHALLWSQQRLAGLRKAARLFGAGTEVYPATVDRVPSYPTRSEEEEECRAFFTSLFSTVSTEGTTELFRTSLEHYRRGTLRFILGANSSLLITRLCREAVETFGATALVGSNDRIALSCLRYLREHHRAGHVNVAGFDNTAAAAANRLTSYSFNTQATINAMVRSTMAHPVRKSTPDRGCIVTAVGGEIVERVSTSETAVSSSV